MALFNNDKAQPAVQPQTQPEPQVEDILAGLEGCDEEIDAADCSSAFLSVAQPGTPAVDEQGHPVATWFNSATQENYGPVIDVIVLHREKIWSERDSDFKTCGRYPVQGIEVNTIPDTNNPGRTQMVNPLTGNVVQELPVYAVLLADKPEAGMLMYTPTKGSAMGFKALDTLLRNWRINGLKARHCTAVYTLTLTLQSYKGKKFAAFSQATRKGILTPALKSSVMPLLDAAKSQLMLTDGTAAE